MNSEQVQQQVFDLLGVIIIDKSMIHENATFAELALDNEDMEKLFKMIESKFDFIFPEAIRKRASQTPEHLTLPILVELIVLMKQS